MLKENIVIIGSGLAGLAAGRTLAAAGKDVVILDKGRRLGGRVATRRADGFCFDHGAQFATAHNPAFMDILAVASAAEAVRDWQRPSGRMAKIGAQMMRDLPLFVSQMPDGSPLDIRQDVEVADITQDHDHICLLDAEGALIEQASHLIITAPAPQTARLLQKAAPELAETARSASYHPCWTVMLGLDTESPDALPSREAPDADLCFVADSRARRPAGTNLQTAPLPPSLVLQAGPQWTRDHLETEREQIISAMMALYQTYLDETHPHISMPAIAYQAAHRWLYARLDKAADPDLPQLSHSRRICLAGDWLRAPRCEAAYESGLHAATQILTAG